MPHSLLIFSQSDYLIQIVDTNSHTECQTVQIQINWLLQKPTDLEIHCFQWQGISGVSRTRVKSIASNKKGDKYFHSCIYIFWRYPSKMLEGHIASGALVHLSVRSSIHHDFWCMLLFWNFFYGFLMTKNSRHIFFFSPQVYASFLSYGPLKKYGCNLVSKISQKLLKLELWVLMDRLVVMNRRPD